MPERAIKRRGGAIRWRTKRVRGGYFRIAVVRKLGPRGGRTVAGKLHLGRNTRKRRIGR